MPAASGLALLAVAAWGILAHQSRLPSAGPAPAWAQYPQVTTVPTAGRQAASLNGKAAGSGQQPASPLPPAPVLPAVLPVGAQSVEIPSLRVAASAEPESVTGGTLGVPANPARVGWWMPSSAELVIDGHVDMAGVGPGALYEVRDLHPGAVVAVRTAGGLEHWKIEGVRTYQKGRVPAGLFRWHGAQARLVIITCGGPFDYATHHYYDNVVAYGVPLQADASPGRPLLFLRRAGQPKERS